MKIKTIILFSILFFLISCDPRTPQLPEDAEDATLIKVGDIIQQIQLTDVDSIQYTIGQNAEKPTLLYFFAPWCGYCKNTTPKIQTLKDEIGDKVQVLAVAREEDRSTLKEWQATVDYTLTLIPDADRSFFAQFAAAYIPRIFVMDKNGKVVFTYIAWDDTVPNMIKESLELK